MDMKPVPGNTYPVRDKLKGMGGRWDATRKLWLVPSHKYDEAVALTKEAASLNPQPSSTDRIAMAVRKRGSTPGICWQCGSRCKYPYDECWDCKEERDMGY